jgi:hypothetical protein
VRFDMKLLLKPSGISPTGITCWVTYVLVMNEGVRLRPPVDGGQTRIWFWVGWEELGKSLAELASDLWITTCNFLGMALLSPSIHRNVGPKGSSFGLDHRLWITLWKGLIADICRFK